MSIPTKQELQTLAKMIGLSRNTVNRWTSSGIPINLTKLLSHINKLQTELEANTSTIETYNQVIATALNAESSPMIIALTRTSMLSNKPHTRLIKLTRAEIINLIEMRKLPTGKWSHPRLMIQSAFPNLSAIDREFIMTGIIPEEWTDLYPTKAREVKPCSLTRSTPLKEPELATLRAEALQLDPSITSFTCDDCAARYNCNFCFDLYNTNGDCLAEK